MNKNILFVLEGAKTEPRLLKHLVTFMRNQEKYEVFTYRTNIHAMLEELFEDDEIDMDLDFIECLRSCKTNRDQNDMLNKKYTDIFLFFDMDPHDQRYDAGKLTKAMDYFNDSTENGKLYLNYPMIESFRHIENLDDLSYLNTTVSLSEIKNYKALVEKTGLHSLSDISKIDSRTLKRIIVLNLRKANMIATGSYNLPDMDAYEHCITQKILFSRQLDKFEEEGRIYVLNTCVFNTVDYMGERFFDSIE